MSLREKLQALFDVPSRRWKKRYPEHKQNNISERLRNRILLLYRDILSGELDLAPNYRNEHKLNGSYFTDRFWNKIHNRLQHLYGRPSLSDRDMRNRTEDVLNFLFSCQTSEFFDFIELSFKLEKFSLLMRNENQVVDGINEIFRVENAPYQLTHLVRTKEEDMHIAFYQPDVLEITLYPKVILAEDDTIQSEVIEPALSVLSAPHFEPANTEFRDALNEYRQGHYGDCLAKCCSAFESVMKILCRRNRWSFNENDVAVNLLKIIIKNSKLAPFFKHPLTLIATMRNELSIAHGAGDKERIVQRHIGQYAVASTAAAIVLLVHEVGR